MNFNQQMTIIKQSLLKQGRKRQSKVKFISPDKWRSIMLKCIERLKNKNIYDNNMLHDLATIVQRIKEEKFIEATLNIQPFRPNFSMRSKKEEQENYQKTSIQNIEEQDLLRFNNKLKNNQKLSSRTSIIKFKQSVHQKLNSSDVQYKYEKYQKSFVKEMLTSVIKQQTLTKQLNSKYHPFKKIIQQFLNLLQSKFKMIIESQNDIQIQDLQQKLIVDIRLIQDFIVKSSQPYLNIFKTSSNEQRDIFQVKLVTFIKQYIQQHDKINLSIRKIIRMASRKTAVMKKLSLKLPDLTVISDFTLPQKFRIEGCYVHTMNAIIQFAEACSSKSSLEQLIEIRKSLGKDIENYYFGQSNAPNHFQMDVQTQLQILKFSCCKLKTFICQIYSQLRYLQVVYGQQDMSFKYDDSSYMYAQISMAIQALELDFA